MQINFCRRMSCLFSDLSVCPLWLLFLRVDEWAIWFYTFVSNCCALLGINIVDQDNSDIKIVLLEIRYMAVADPRYSPGSDANYTTVTLRIRITCRVSNFLINRVNMDISNDTLLHGFSIFAYLYCESKYVYEIILLAVRQNNIHCRLFKIPT